MKKFDFWVDDPSTKKDSVSLTIALLGLLFTIVFVFVISLASWINNNPIYLKYLSGIITALLTPTLGAFTINKFTNAKYGIPQSKDSVKVNNKKENK